MKFPPHTVLFCVLLSSCDLGSEESDSLEGSTTSTSSTGTSGTDAPTTGDLPTMTTGTDAVSSEGDGSAESSGSDGTTETGFGSFGSSSGIDSDTEPVEEVLACDDEAFIESYDGDVLSTCDRWAFVSIVTCAYALPEEEEYLVDYFGKLCSCDVAHATAVDGDACGDARLAVHDCLVDLVYNSDPYDINCAPLIDAFGCEDEEVEVTASCPQTGPFFAG